MTQYSFLVENIQVQGDVRVDPLKAIEATANYPFFGYHVRDYNIVAKDLIDLIQAKINRTGSFVEHVGMNTPADYKLSQNYPNPFNPATTIEFSLPKSGYVTVKVFNTLGEEIQTLVDQDLLPGNYRVQLDARSLASGVYFYRMVTSRFQQTREMIVIR